MVSPTPVFGFELAEKLQGYLAHLSGPSTLAKDTVEILFFYRMAIPVAVQGCR
jgi:hypothetical protein